MVAGNPVSVLGTVPLTLVVNVAYGTSFWVYLSGLRGVYRFGLEPLSLKPFYEDRMLGLLPLGQLVASLALTSSGAITITLGASLITGDVGSIAINLVIVALGVAMVFVPLEGIHRRMVGVKEDGKAAPNSRSKELLVAVRNRGTGDQEPTSKLEELIQMQRFQTLRTEALMISE